MEVFEGNKMLGIIVSTLVIVAVVVGIYAFDVPLVILPIALVIVAIILLTVLTNKILIEDSMLQYKKLGSLDEVDLREVAAIYVREVETYISVDRNRDNHRGGIAVGTKSGIQIGGREQETERRIEKVVYVVDNEGRVFFSFPQSLIGVKDRQRFRDAVHKINPNIEVL